MQFIPLAYYPSSWYPPLFSGRMPHGLIWSLDCSILRQDNLQIASNSTTYSHLHLHFLPAMSLQWWGKWKKIHASKPTSPGWAKLPECNRGEASSFVFHAAAARERAAIPCRLTGQIMLRYQPQPRKRITCVQIELSVWKLKMQSFPRQG